MVVVVRKEAWFDVEKQKLVVKEQEGNGERLHPVLNSEEKKKWGNQQKHRRDR